MDDSAVQSAALPHIEFISPDVAPVSARRTTTALLGEVIAALPNLGKLSYRLLRDPRVPRRSKVLVGAAAVYFVSPVDLVPELLFPIVGRIDDLLVLAFALDRLMKSVEPDVVREHWDGDGDALELAGALVAWAAEMMPRPLRRIMDRVVRGEH